MATVTDSTMKTLILALIANTELKATDDIRDIIWSHINKTDIVPPKHYQNMKKVFFNYYYNTNGKGYKGIKNEVNKRIRTMEFTEKTLAQGGIPVEDFMVKKLGDTDTIDTDNHAPYEEKSGCGNWLYSDNPFFDEVIQEYRRKRTKIRWDYSFTIETKRNGTETYHFYVVTTYARFFDYLKGYNGSLDTWFKENKRSGKAGTYIWELQNIVSSRKKAEYLKNINSISME